MYVQGDKVLVRYGLALINGYKKSIKAGEFNDAEIFWTTVQSDAKAVGTFQILEKSRNYFENNRKLPARKLQNMRNRKSNMMKAYMAKNIHEHAYDSVRGNLKKAMKPMKISKNNFITISKVYKGMQNGTIKPVLHAPYYPTLGCEWDNDLSRCHLVGDESTDAINIDWSQIHQVGDNVGSGKGVLSVTYAESLAKVSTILCTRTAGQIFTLCCPTFKGTESFPYPVPSTYDLGLHLVFSTATHGYSRSSLYDRVKELSPLVIIIKSTVNKGKDHFEVRGTSSFYS